MRKKSAIAVIGGTGLYDVEGLETVDTIDIDTPFGKPSSSLTVSQIEDTAVYFLARHGTDHSILPSNVNYRANIWALKSLGCDRIISIAAVGSLKEEIKPGHLLLADQFIDKTHRRAQTFFEEEIAAHVGLADPFSANMRQAALSQLQHMPNEIHTGGTYVCMEGPQFSTRAESLMHISWGGSVIGMTICPEAKLAREAEMAYCPICLISDYDCWNTDHDSVTAESAISVLVSLTSELKKVLPSVLSSVKDIDLEIETLEALSAGLITDLSGVDSRIVEKLKPILARHMELN